MSELSLSQTPPGGWQFCVPQTGWCAPTPISSTFSQTVDLIRKHRLANPAIVQKYGLATDYNSVAEELIAFTRTRLGLSDTFSDPPRPGERVQSGRCCGG